MRHHCCLTSGQTHLRTRSAPLGTSFCQLFSGNTIPLGTLLLYTMLCSMCETAIQAAFTNLGPGIYPVRQHVVHRYHHTFLDSVIKGCFLCRRACRVEHWPQDPPSQIPTGFDLLDSYRSEWEERLLPFPTDPPMECLRASVSSITQKTLPKELDRLVRLLKSWDCESPFLQCCMYWGTNEKECRVDIFNIPPQDRMDLARDSESETEDLESEIEYVYTSVSLCPAVAATKEPTPLSGNKFSRHGVIRHQTAQSYGATGSTSARRSTTSAGPPMGILVVRRFFPRELSKYSQTRTRPPP